MLRDELRRVFRVCFEAIGGQENPDVRYVLHERPSEVTRDAFFGEAAWAIMVSGIRRKSASTFSARAIRCGFSWDFREVASWTDEDWSQFLGRLYPDGVSGRGGKKWAAIRRIAELSGGFEDEDSFRREVFGGKMRSADLNRDDIRRLAARRLSWVRHTNAQYIVRNMGGETIKCDRWLGELITYLGMSGPELERELVSAGISLSLFDVVIWAYCEAFVQRVADFRPHFDRLLAGGCGPELLN